MASFLDISLLSEVSVIFTFLLVWVLIYALLERLTPFGDGKRGIHAILAFVIGIFTVNSPMVSEFVNFMTPWFTLMIITAFFFIFAAQMFNPDENMLAQAIKQPRLYAWILVLGGFIIAFSFSHVFGQQLLDLQGPGGAPAQAAPAGGQPAVVDPNQPTITDPGAITDSGKVIRNPVPSGSTATQDYGQNFALTIFHPKIIGMLFIMLIGTFTILLLARY